MFAIDRPEVIKFKTEGRLGLREEQNPTKSHVSTGVTAPYPSLYFRTCLEELTRNYISYTVAADDAPILEMEDSKPKVSKHLRFPSVQLLDAMEPEEVNYDSKEDNHRLRSRFLQAYHPHAPPLSSTFRRVPSVNKHVVGDWCCGYTKLLIDVGPHFKVRINRHTMFEPLFGSVSLYSLNRKVESDFAKITETFYFDATPPSVRDDFVTVYTTDLAPVAPEREGTRKGMKLKKQKIHPLSDCSRCLFCVPNSILETHDIYVVVKLSKVLSGDPDKSLMPYISPDKKSFMGSSSPETLRGNAIVDCDRLNRFRQTVGLSAIRVFNRHGFLNQERGGIEAPVYAMKSNFNDLSLKQIIQDLHNEDNSSKNPPPITELTVMMTMINLGTGGDLRNIPIPECMPSVRTANTFKFIPSQYLTKEASNEFPWYDELGKDIAELVSVKLTLPLLHPSCSLTDDAMSGYRASIDNSMFLYPVSLENMSKNHRNLCVRIQLVELHEDCTGDRDSLSLNISPCQSHTVLKNIYNSMPGDYFAESYYTQVSYHKPSPEFGDEIKIRLPLNLNKNHSLLFHVYHVHVKNKDGRRHSLFSSKHEVDQIVTLVGSGYLPILSKGSCLLADGDHVVNISEVDEGSSSVRLSQDMSHDSVSSISTLQSVPTSTRVSSGRRTITGASNLKLPLVFTIRSKTISSFMSQNDDLHEMLTAHPPPLGYLPSLSLDEMKTTEYTVYPRYCSDLEEEVNSPLNSKSGANSVDEGILKEKTIFLANLGSTTKSTKIDICKHFFGLMRQLLRSMCGGGSCDFSIAFANPYSHSELRCVSFIAMLQVFNVVTPERLPHGAGSGDNDGEPLNQDFLHEYVDHMFDEEVLDLDRNNGSDNTRGKGMSLSRMASFFSTKTRSKLESDDNSVDVYAEHLLQQVESVVIHGSLLSALGKVTDEIMTTGTVKLVADESTDSSHPRRWWKGRAELKPLLEHIVGPRENLENMLAAARKNVNPLKESIVIEPILEPFDELDGFASRSVILREVFKQSKSKKESSQDKVQWWPYAYEVISYQWVTLLHVFQDNAHEKERNNAHIPKIEEEEEDDDTDTLEWNTMQRYPLTELQYLFNGKNEIRTLLLNNGPVLLSIILKSLALRILREHKSTPVIMDQDFMNLMEDLLGALAQEVHCKGVSLLPARRLNISISHFLRELFGFIVPLQSAQLVYSYFLSSRKAQKQNFESTGKVQVTHITDRFHILKELTQTDHFFAFNFPVHLGSPHASFKFNPIFSQHDLIAESSLSKIRGIQNPPSHWLAHLLIQEVMYDFESLEKNMKEAAMKLIRSLVVRLSYDKRFQTNEYRFRIASMFLPLLSCIVEDVDRIRQLPTNSEERKDSLALVVYILQDIPDYLLREELRDMMKYGQNLLRMKKISKHTQQSESVQSDAPRLEPKHDLAIFHLLQLFHLVVDTFEFPLSMGGESGDISCLSPGVGMELDDIDGPMTYSQQSTRKGTIGLKERVGTNNALSMLENMHSAKKRVGPRKRLSGDKAAVSQDAANDSSGMKNSRTSPRNLNSVSTFAHRKHTGQPMPMINMLNGLSAAKHVSNESALYVLCTMRIIILECMKVFEPNILSMYCDTEFGMNMKRVLGDSMNVILHILHSKQSEVVLCQAYLQASRILTILGARCFIRTLTVDTLQFWMRQVLLHCGSLYAPLREAAASFLGYLLFTCFDGLGSLRPVSTLVFAVLRDVLESLERQYESRPQFLENATYLKPFDKAFFYAKKAILGHGEHSSSALSGCLLSIEKFFQSVNLLLKVYSFISLKMGYFNVSFDWEGANTLDSMDYDDSAQPRGEDKMKQAVGFSKKDMVAESMKGIDTEGMLQQFIDAATIIDDYELPRVRMHILENLARIHDMMGNSAEAGMTRWEIYLTMKRVDNCGQNLWSPRPPLKLSDIEVDFMSALHKSLAQGNRVAWQSKSQFQKHMVTILTASAKRFREAKLTFLAERSIYALLDVYRRQEDCDENDYLLNVAKAYEELNSLYAKSSVGNTTFAMGTFYRVHFLGKDVSNELRNKEYVVRNAEFLHLSEFQALIKSDMSKHVKEGTPINVLSDTASHPAENEPGAFIVMTALTPIFDSYETGTCSKNCIRKFKFSVPFTKEGRAHAKSIDLQWKRTIYVEIPHPFPYLTFRQKVNQRTSRDLCPIEVAIDDINDRVFAMRLQLQQKNSKEQVFINNLMRLVQGTVAPQVNAGAVEVARVFLNPVDLKSAAELSSSPHDSTPDSSRQNQLKTLLVEFLKLSKFLLERARKVLGNEEKRSSGVRTSESNGSGGNVTGDDAPQPTHSSVSSSSGGVHPPPPPDSPQLNVDNHHMVWQQEMDKGYEILLDSIFPYIKDICSIRDFITLC